MPVAPNVLWDAACRDATDEQDRRELYRHAMTEAGYIVAAATGEPYAICPECGWQA